MEIVVVALVAVGFWLVWKANQSNDTLNKEETPTPVDAKASTQKLCGCGRSPSGFCVGLHAFKWNTSFRCCLFNAFLNRGGSSCSRNGIDDIENFSCHFSSRSYGLPFQY